MPRTIPLTLVVVFLLLVNSACTKKVYTSVPGAGQGDLLNRASQDDIAKRFGPASSKQMLSDGGEVWAYDYRSTTTTGGNEGHATSVSQCYRVIYVFDKGKKLRDYRREGC